PTSSSSGIVQLKQPRPFSKIEMARRNQAGQVVDMRLQLPPDSNLAETLKSLMNRPFHIHVEYLDKLPEPLEPQAVVWTDFG
ncbi:hypothetical protein, partial [Burkholderia pseudomallei]